MKRETRDILRLIRAVEQLRRRDELALVAERKSSADALAAIGQIYAAADDDWRQAALHLELYRDRLIGLSGRQKASNGRADELAGSLQLADGRLKALVKAHGQAVEKEERRRDERDLTERVALSAFPASSKPRDT